MRITNMRVELFSSFVGVKHRSSISNALLGLFKAVALLLALSSAVASDEYPNRPVRLIIPFPPGGSNDVVGRLVAKQLSEQLGQTVYVDNRGGAGGTIGTEAAVNAAPDGYTLLIVSLAHAVNPALPVKSVKELLALVKQKPGELNYASAGVGSFQHLGGELFKLMAGANMVHVPYKGGGPAMQDVIAGHVKIIFSSLVQTTPFIQSGQLRALGTGGAKRSSVLPDVPTIAEAGVPGYVADNWWGIVAPAGLPAPIAEKLYKASQAALKAPELKAQFDREGASVVVMTSDEFAEYIKTEIVKWGRVVKEGKIGAQ